MKANNLQQMDNLDKKCVDAIRILSAEAIQKANSGHPGLPLGSAAIGYELFGKHLRHNPKNPTWQNRDRFILSAGHGSMLLYSLLHLFDYGLTIEDIKNFRQLDSFTPGHPEYGHTVGVEATTGPLGAGMGMAVGMAMAEAHLGAIFNEENYPIVDHYTFVLGGDGCLMEGISSEAFSLAGTLRLHKLIVLYDSNAISIEGSTDIAFTENVQQRMEAFGFQVLTVEDGNNLQEIGKAIEKAKAEKTKPSFITIKTIIGYGCPAKAGTANAHGEPLGEDNLQALKTILEWEEKTPFEVPPAVYEHYQALAKQGVEAEKKWQELFQAYSEKFPKKRKKWDLFHTNVAKNILDIKDFWQIADTTQATRNSSYNLLQIIKNIVPNLIGGSADLAPSNKSRMNEEGDFSATNYAGRNLHFGVREIAMAAIANGICLHGGLRPYVATFFVFSDYMKPMMRLAALMKLPIIYVLTHDSIGVGEDGPTHEPIEQLAMLRSMPNISVFRPADSMETNVAWYFALTNTDRPVAIILTRQNLPQLIGSNKDAIKGAYIISEEDVNKKLDGIFIATGSEVHLAIAAQELLLTEGVNTRVVSMPSMDIFARQTKKYQEFILPKKIVNRVAVEAGSSFGWERYIGLKGDSITINTFGASAPATVLFKKFGFTKENIAQKMKYIIKQNSIEDC